MIRKKTTKKPAKKAAEKKPFDIRNWLKEQPQPDEVMGEAGKQYIPIGIIENLLDRFDAWSTSEFKFAIVRTDKYWFADASILLTVGYTKSNFFKQVIGAVTYQISSQDENQDHSATALSLATANAAKKLGIRFGRALNDRLTVGDMLPVIQAEKNVFNIEAERTKAVLRDCKTLQELQDLYTIANSPSQPKDVKIVYEEMFKKLHSNELE